MTRTVMVFMLWATLTPNVQTQTDTLLMSKPDVMIEVKKSQVLADYVDIKVVLRDYPPELLLQQCERIGKYLKSEVRGLTPEVTDLGRAGKVVGAKMAVNGLIDRERGVLRLAPLAMAFADSPNPHTIKVLAVQFVGERPQASTLKGYDGPDATVAAQFDESIPQIEYRVTLKTQNPDMIQIPDAATPQQNRLEKPSKTGPAWWYLIGIAGVGVVVGVLVYFALRPYHQKRSGSKSGNLR